MILLHDLVFQMVTTLLILISDDNLALIFLDWGLEWFLHIRMWRLKEEGIILLKEQKGIILQGQLFNLAMKDGYGKMTQGTATIEYTIEGVGGQKTTEIFIGEYTKGDAWFIIYGWEIYQGESISIEAAASYRENNVIYSPPAAVLEGTNFQTNVPIKGDFNQVMFGFGISFWAGLSFL